MGILGLCLLIAITYACDTWLFSQGYDTPWHKHNSPAEKELQQLKLDKLRKEVQG